MNVAYDRTFTDNRDGTTTQLRDVAEGADFLMVKPALPYLDIMSEARELAPNHPLACYQVSGEFSMLHAGAQAGVYDLKAMAFETVEGFLRAGASVLSLGRRGTCAHTDTHLCRLHARADLLHAGFPRLARRGPVEPPSARIRTLCNAHFSAPLHALTVRLSDSRIPTRCTRREGAGHIHHACDQPPPPGCIFRIQTKFLVRELILALIGVRRKEDSDRTCTYSPCVHISRFCTCIKSKWRAGEKILTAAWAGMGTQPLDHRQRSSLNRKKRLE